MTVQERFATDHNMPAHLVSDLVRLALTFGKCNEHACNGDDHQDAPKGDKNAAAKRWTREVQLYGDNIAQLVKPYGFDYVTATGLGPTLKRGEQFVEIPY